MILLKAQYTHIGHFRQIEEIRNLGFLDIQKNMKQDTLNFRACVALCFDDEFAALSPDAFIEKYILSFIMTVCGWCIGAICAGIATLINPEEVLNLEMLAMELITFFVVQAVAGIMIAIRLRFEGEKGRIVLPIAILIIFAICYTIGSFLKANLELKESIWNVIGGTGDLEIAIALIVLSLLVWYASYRYSMRVMRKKEF